MLKFTPEQQAQIVAARNSFNQRMVALAANAAMDIQGNALAIPLDAWRRIDTRAQTLARTRLPIFNRLAQASTIPVSIADLVNYYPQVSDSGDVLVSMDGRNTAKADSPLQKFAGTPVPILTSNARLGWRQMEVLRKGGNMLDTTSIANNQRKIAEKLEDMVLNGLPSIVVGDATIYGLRTIGQIVEIIPAASVPANEVLGIVDLDTGEWGGILSAMPMTTRPKTRIEPEDDYVFGVITAAAPQFRSDYAGQSAFVHGTTA